MAVPLALVASILIGPGDEPAAASDLTLSVSSPSVIEGDAGATTTLRLPGRPRSAGRGARERPLHDDRPRQRDVAAATSPPPRTASTSPSASSGRRSRSPSTATTIRPTATVDLSVSSSGAIAGARTSSSTRRRTPSAARSTTTSPADPAPLLSVEQPLVIEGTPALRPRSRLPGRPRSAGRGARERPSSRRLTTAARRPHSGDFDRRLGRLRHRRRPAAGTTIEITVNGDDDPTDGDRELVRLELSAIAGAGPSSRPDDEHRQRHDLRRRPLPIPAPLLSVSSPSVIEATPARRPAGLPGRPRSAGEAPVGSLSRRPTTAARRPPAATSPPPRTASTSPSASSERRSRSPSTATTIRPTATASLSVSSSAPSPAPGPSSSTRRRTPSAARSTTTTTHFVADVPVIEAPFGASVVEGDAGQRTMVFPVTLDRPSAATVTSTTRPRTSIRADSSRPTTPSSSIRRDLRRDRGPRQRRPRARPVRRPDEPVPRQPDRRYLPVRPGFERGDILDDDDFVADLPVLEVHPASVIEGDAGQRTMVFPVTLDRPSTGTVAFHYEAEDFVWQFDPIADFEPVDGTFVFSIPARPTARSTSSSTATSSTTSTSTR